MLSQGKYFTHLKPFLPFFVILVLYFCTLLVFLIRLPVFNDESIYLDWAWSALHVPGHAFDSLLDAKQPLMVWVFGVFEILFSNALFAGRLASVMMGSLTLTGIYVLTKKLLTKQIALIAAFIYCVTPLFVFYNRQALMESGVATVGIWSFIVLLNFLQKPTKKNSLILGFILGIGFLLKSSIVLFFFPTFFILNAYLFRHKNIQYLKNTSFSILAFLVTTYLIFVQPNYWLSFQTNTRFTYTLSELFRFPIFSWADHLKGFFEIGFYFITPLLFLSGLGGIYLMKKMKIKFWKLFCCYFIGALILEIVLVRVQSQRYLLVFLPFLTISAAFTLALLWKGNLVKKLAAIITMIIPIISSFILIIYPSWYISQLSHFTKYSELFYIQGQTSGYGIEEAKDYIKRNSSEDKPTLVLFALNAGNPENAMNLFAQQHKNMFGIYIDAAIFEGLDQIECLSSEYSVFFVTRSVELAGMNRFFELETSFPNPDGKYFVGIYTLKKECGGKTLSLSEFYQPAIERMRQYKKR